MHKSNEKRIYAGDCFLNNSSNNNNHEDYPD